RCDVDHTVQRQHGGGHTRDNLALACRHHHRAKDEGSYRLRQLGHGRLQWITPLGHTYTSDPGPPF
ncbi:MAG: HNH endonuclease, partial [Micromonosporaceae bacterium]